MKEKSAAHLLIETLSHRGLVRKKNEDRLGYRYIKLKVNIKLPALVAVLADGVGGHRAGEVAAQIAVDTIVAHFEALKTIEEPHQELQAAIINANQAILEEVSVNPENVGMGTTCICTLILGQKMYAAHLGDSRLYLLRKRSLRQLTRDHTLLEEFQRMNIHSLTSISRDHPLSHILSRHLGAPQPNDVDISINDGKSYSTRPLVLEKDDILLLCSDGLTDMLTDPEITDILLSCPFRKCAQRLVYDALQRGGHDNASVIVIKVSG